jgi:hypothetical protein
MFCPSCKHENRAGRKFCVHCGAGLESSCPSCGARAEPGEQYCGECGKSLAGLIKDVGWAARRAFQERWLQDNGKLIVV